MLMSGEAAWNVSSSRFSEEFFFSSFKAQLQRVCCMTLPKEGNCPEGSEALLKEGSSSVLAVRCEDRFCKREWP